MLKNYERPIGLKVFYFPRLNCRDFLVL